MIANNKIVTNSLILSAILNTQHKSIIALVKRYQNDFEVFGRLRKSEYNYGKGRPIFVYYLDSQQTKLLINYISNTPITRMLKKAICKDEMNGGAIKTNNENMKVVYIIHSTDNSVKIGVTNNPKRRINAIRTQSGKNLDEIYYTEYCSNAFKIESFLKKKYSKKRISGEWFNIDYLEGKKELEKAFNKMAKFEPSDTTELAEDLIDFAVSYTKTLNTFFISKVDPALAEEVNTCLTSLNHYLYKINDFEYATGVYKDFLSIAYNLIDISEAGEIKNISYEQMLNLILLERIICECIRHGISENKKYKLIYQDCKVRCETAKQIAFIG